MEMNLFINYEQGKKNINYYKHNPKVFIDKKLKKKFIVFILFKLFLFSTLTLFNRIFTFVVLIFSDEILFFESN